MFSQSYNASVSPFGLFYQMTGFPILSYTSTSETRYPLIYLKPEQGAPFD